MQNKRDYYDVLGVDRNADANTIKKAYRKLAKKYHPDSNAGDAQAEQMFKEVTEAYNVLSDKEKKKLYDQFGHAAFDGTGAASQGGFSGYGDPGSGYQEFHFEGGNMDDILKEFFGGHFGGFGQSGTEGHFGGFRQGGNGDPFSGFRQNRSGGGFRGTQSGRQSNGFYGNFAQKGQDVRADINISFEDAVFGCQKLLNLAEEGGKKRTIQIRIPAGIEDGRSLRLRGKGYPGTGGGEAGDLLLNVHVSEKPGFQRKGSDIYTTATIPFLTAALGGEVKVHTLYGDVLCKIREGTQSGSRIRLKGKGVGTVNAPNVKGDQYVTVQIQVPRNLSEESRRKLREFDESMKRSGRSGEARG